jgi:hypothetical protein
LKVDVDELMSHIFDILKSICRERFVNRRVALMGLSVGENGPAGSKDEDKSNLQEMTRLAEQFIDFVKVRQLTAVAAAAAAAAPNANDSTSVQVVHEVVLPSDSEGFRKQDHHQSGDQKDEPLTLEDIVEENPMSATEVVLIRDKLVTLPVIAAALLLDKSAQQPGKGGGGGGAGGSLAAAAVAVAKAKADAKTKATNLLNSNLPAMFTGKLTVVAVDKALAMERELVITMKSDSDGDSVAVNVPGSARLPMLCAVEKELAIEFTLSLISRLAVEMRTVGDHNPIIRIMDGQDGGDKNVDIGHFFEDLN